MKLRDYARTTSGKVAILTGIAVLPFAGTRWDGFTVTITALWAAAVAASYLLTVRAN